MKEHVKDAEVLVASALNEGNVILPQSLLDTVARLSSPLNFLTSIEPEAEPFDVIREEYPALHLRRCGARSLNPTETEEAVGLLRWVLRELSAWTRECDPRLVTLTAVIIMLNEFDWGDAQWALLSDKAVNPELIKLLVNIVNGYRCEISSEPGHRSSTTRALVAMLEKADSEGDWAVISASWQQIETWLYGGFLLELAVPCLARFDMSGLGSAIGEVSQVQVAYLVARTLSEANRVKLARATSSHRYRFASVLSLAWGNNVFKKLGDETQEELSALLAEVSNDSDQWPHWMQAFNVYPIRFPSLQPSLGKALALAPEHALGSYVDSISLYAWPLSDGQSSRSDGSKCVELCLNTFREAAAFEQRCRLWHLAHTRWQCWHFGLHSTSKQHLGEVVGSELDFAITAYSAECLKPEARKALLASLIKELHGLETSWYSSISGLVSSRYSCISKMQPLLAADSAEWLFTQPLIPSEISQNPYTQRKFE